MKLTKRGKLVGGLFGALLFLGLMVGAWKVGDWLDLHTGYKNCKMEAEGWTCDTFWK
jgi:hypothetical protein